MKEQLEQRLSQALAILKANGTVQAHINPDIQVSRSRQAGQGDFASNLGLVLGCAVGCEPQKMAQLLVDALPALPGIQAIEVAPLGFINFYLSDEKLADVVATILSQGKDFGSSRCGAGQSVVVFHWGEKSDGGAGSTAGLLQARLEAKTVALARMLQTQGFAVYCLRTNDGSLDEGVVNDRQDSIRSSTRESRLEQSFVGKNLARESATSQWAGPANLFQSSFVDVSFTDACLIREFERLAALMQVHSVQLLMITAATDQPGQITNKLQLLNRVFEKAFGCRARADQCHVVAVQPVVLQSGKLAGVAGDATVPRGELHEYLGKNAACYFNVMRKSTQRLELDLELAASQSISNPAYSVQLAFSRVCSVRRQLARRGWTGDQSAGIAALGRLTEAAEKKLIKTLQAYPELIHQATQMREPYPVAGYLRDLANGLHSYYGVCKVVLLDDDELRNARICLLLAVRQVLANGLALINVSTPEVM